MNPEFEKISKYCIDNNIDFPVRNQAFAIYTQRIEDAIENHKAENGGKISPREEQAIQNMLISDSYIKDYIISSNQIISTIKESAIKPYIKQFDWREFWVSVGASVIGAFIFSILLVTLIFVSHEQIKSIVAPIVYESLVSPRESNEQEQP